jgi:hypothetical protein
MVAFARHAVVETAGFLRFSAVSGALFLLLPELLARFLENAGFAAAVFVRRTAVLASVLGWHLAFAALLMLLDPSWHDPEFTAYGASRFFLIGAIVGVVIRLVFVAYLMRVLRGVSTDEAEAALLAVVAGYLWIFPASPSHDMFAPFYLIGVAAGCLLHFLVRRGEQSSAREAQMRQSILIALDDVDGPWFHRKVGDAIEMYIHQRWRALRKFFEAADLDLPPLAVIHASMEWFLGEPRKALAIVDRELQRERVDEGYTTCLLILKALCHADLDQPAAALQAMELALTRRGACLLTKVLLALFIAWQVPLGGTRTPEQEARLARALDLISAALQQAEEYRRRGEAGDTTRLHYSNGNERVTALLVGKALPVTRTFLLGTYAYISFRCGQVMLAESLLDDCLKRDQKCAYLHLYRGEVYLSLARTASNDEELLHKYRRRAGIALHIAIELERGRDSAVKRRARHLLQESEPHRASGGGAGSSVRTAARRGRRKSGPQS